MRHFNPLLYIFLLLSFYLCSPSLLAENPQSVPILVYHNFNPTVPGSMSITPDRFAAQLKWIKDNGYTVIPLKDLVSKLEGKDITLPAKSVVITADDGWESVYVYMYPLVREYHIPVTLFIYPETISHGLHAMTWNQLKELQNTGLFDIQGHTYWHPNFKQEKRHLSAEAYQKLVHVQLYTSKDILEKKLGTPITLLAWPFGIYDNYLEQQAADAGYTMAFSIDGRRAKNSEKAMSQPRYMIVEGQSMKTFAAIVRG
jgi:peptidoglycan/xylan/chitin deacetylase (PgdA/CDA1 family)